MEIKINKLKYKHNFNAAQGNLNLTIDKMFNKVGRKLPKEDKVIMVNNNLYRRIKMEEPIVDYPLLKNYNFMINNELKDNVLLCTRHPEKYNTLNKSTTGAILLTQ